MTGFVRKRPKPGLLLLVNVGVVMGGAEVYTERLASLLYGHVPMIAFCAQSTLAERLRSAGVRTYTLPLVGKRGFNRGAKYFSGLIMLILLVLRYRIRAVHFNGYQTSYLIPFARVMGCETFITPHHLPESIFFRKWYRLTARWVGQVVSVSAVSDHVHRDLLPSVRTTVIPNWIPEIPSRALLIPKTPSRKLLFVGRLVNNKGLSTLLDALRKLENTELLIAGEGPLRERMQAEAADLPVTFLGYAPDLTRLYTEVDALVVPSLGPEGSCLVALEAMAAGLPCIMSDLQVYKEIAEDGKAALVFKAGDPDDLVRAIQQLMTDRPDAIMRANYARSLMESVYSEPAVKARYLSLFSDLKSEISSLRTQSIS